MTKFIHVLTGTVMYVESSREAEYIAAGHKPAADYVVQEADTEKPKARRRKKE